MVWSNRVLRALIVPVAILVLWTAISSLGLPSPGLFPPPHRILTVLWSIREEVPTLLEGLLATAIRGLLIGGVSGIGVGLVFGYSRWVRERFVFTFDVLRLIPLLGLLPLLRFWVEIATARAAIVVVALGVFPIVAIRTVEMVRSLNPKNPLPALAAGGSPSSVDRTAAISVMIARFLDVARSAVAAALGLAVAIELLGQAGLGVRVWLGTVDRDTATVISTTLISTWLLFAVLTIGTDSLLGTAARSVTSWARRRRERSGLRGVASGVGKTGIVEESAPAPAKHLVQSRRGLTLHRLVLLLGVLIVWVWATGRGHLDRVLFPAPWDLVELLTGGSGYRSAAGGPFVEDLLGAAWATVRGVLLGLLIGTACGLLAAFVLTSSRWARDLLKFSLKVLRPAPLYAIVPLSLLWFGLGTGAQVAAIALGAFLILTIYASDAVVYISDSNGRADTATGASRVHVGRSVAMPAMLPHLVAGLRLAAVTAWGLGAATELMVGSAGSIPGLVSLMLMRILTLDIAAAWLITFLYVGMAILSDYLLRAVARICIGESPGRAPLGLVE